MENLEQLVSDTQQTCPAQIYVLCAGQGNWLIDMATPRFHGHNSTEHLRRIHIFYENKTNLNIVSDSTNNLLYIIDLCLENHSARWFMLIKNYIKTLDDFHSVFKKKVLESGGATRHQTKIRGWEIPTPREFKLSILFYRKSYHPLSDPTTTHVGRNRDMLAEHFEELIQDVRQVQRIDTIMYFELLLQREDLK